MSLSFEKLLSRDGYLVYKTRGVSMEPMLRQNRDTVGIRIPLSRLKKNTTLRSISAAQITFFTA